MQASLIIAVYNQTRNLELILETVKQQTCKDIEIIVADHGSGNSTIISLWPAGWGSKTKSMLR